MKIARDPYSEREWLMGDDGRIVAVRLVQNQFSMPVGRLTRCARTRKSDGCSPRPVRCRTMMPSGDLTPNTFFGDSTMTSTTKLDNNAFALNRAMREFGHCEPASAICRDGHHSGTLFTWLPDSSCWVVFDIENRQHRGIFDRLAVVSLEPSDEPDRADDGLNQAALGMDMESQPAGEWIVDADDLDSLRESYGDELTVIWEQG